MTGWIRIGIVISLLWTSLVVGFSVYEYYVFPFDQASIVESIDPNYQGYKFIYIQQTSNRDTDRGIYEQMLREAKTEKEKQEVVTMGDKLQQSIGVHWVKLASCIALPIGLIWMLFILSVRIWECVARGFENERK